MTNKEEKNNTPKTLHSVIMKAYLDGFESSSNIQDGKMLLPSDYADKVMNELSELFNNKDK